MSQKQAETQPVDPNPPSGATVINDAVAPSTYKTQLYHNRFTFLCMCSQSNEMHIQQVHANTEWWRAAQ